jgi:hypothetical protein
MLKKIKPLKKAIKKLGTKWNGLNRNKRPAQISSRKIEKLNAEVEARIALAKRCGGKPIIRTTGINLKDGIHLLTTVKCVGGTCECGCNRPANSQNGDLFPHEKLWRGRGGKLSLLNSIMVLNDCHRVLQNREPQLSWIR